MLPRRKASSNLNNLGDFHCHFDLLVNLHVSVYILAPADASILFV